MPGSVLVAGGTLIAGPPEDAGGTVAPPITVNSPIVFTPQDPTLSAFSPQRPAAFTIQTVNFTNVPYPNLQQWNFSLQYEVCYTNLLTMLDLGGIPLHSKDRTLAHPLVVCGGPGAQNPEILAPFVDLFVI